MSPHSKSEVGAVILAAGESSRLGQPKQLIAFRGKALVCRAVDAACEARCSPVVVVAGSSSEEIRHALGSTRAMIVDNKNWRRGIGNSIRTGVQAVTDKRPDVNAIVLLVCDQPRVDARVIKRLVTLRSKTHKDIIASKYADTLGVPALFSSAFFRELCFLEDWAGAKSIIHKNRDRVAELAFPGGEIDVDTWEQWEKVNRR